jgi:hypothetical protein
MDIRSWFREFGLDSAKWIIDGYLFVICRLYFLFVVAIVLLNVVMAVISFFGVFRA